MRQHRRTRVTNTVIAVTLLSAAPAFAQQSAAEASATNALEQDRLEEIVVTGSRLVRPGVESPIPVTSLSAEEIDLAGTTNLVYVVNELPALGQNGADARNNFRGQAEIGTSLLNLRSLGVNRTLVVVDGRRHVGSVAGGSAVDINTIPAALIERIEVSTGGASVAYGADAVTGVVNFILKDDFDGFRIDTRAGSAEEGDGENLYLGVTGGRNFARGRGNFTVSLTYDESRRIAGVDRDVVARNTFFGINPADTGPDDGIPARILFDNALINVTNDTGVLFGLVTGSLGPGGLTGFNDAGEFVPFDFGTPIGGSFSVGGDGFNLADVIAIQNPVERILLDGRFNFAVTPKLNVFAEAKFSAVDASNTDQPTGDFFAFLDGDRASFFLSDQNPFLPFGDPDFDAFFAANTIPGVGPLVLYSRFHSDLGLRRTEAERDLLRLAAGIDGQLPFFDADYEVYAQYGRTEADVFQRNNRNSRRFAFAVDAVSDALGNPACRVTRDTGGATGDPDIDGCLPLNIFGFGNFDPAARGYVLTDLHERTELEQSVLSAAVTGSLFPLPAGRTAFAAGFEWRREQSDFLPDPLQISGNNFDGQTPPLSGEYEVYEAYAELLLPLLADQPFAKTLNLELGGRVSDYDTVGNTNAYRLNLDWAPVEDIRFRWGIAEAVRAPNINELFQQQNQTFAGVADPCDQDNVGLGPDPARRAANCAALGIPADFDDPLAAVTKLVLTGGNPDLDEETAESVTIGVVFAPRFAPGLSVTADYFDIEIEQAVFTESATAIANKCVDLFDAVDNAFCEAITRNPTTFAISSIEALPLNIGALEVTGVDFEANYSIDFADVGLGNGGWGDLSIRLIGTYLDELNVIPSGDPAELDRDAGEIGTPEWQANLSVIYNRGPFSFNWRLRWIDASEFDVQDDDAENLDPAGFGSHAVSDTQFRYRFGAGDRHDAYLGINNVFNREPPRGSRQSTSVQNTIYDVVGRYFYLGASLRFD